MFQFRTVTETEIKNMLASYQLSCLIDIDWSISDKFGVWYNDWNFPWKPVESISLQKPSPQYQPKWTINWSSKWGFAAFSVKVGYCSNIPTNLNWRSLLCALSTTLRYEVTWHWKSLWWEVIDKWMKYFLNNVIFIFLDGANNYKTPCEYFPTDRYTFLMKLLSCHNRGKLYRKEFYTIMYLN